MLKAWMLEHTQCLLHGAATLSPCESSGMYLCMLCLLLVLRAALTYGPQLRYFRRLFTLLASEIPLKEKGSVSGCPQWGLCFSWGCVWMCLHVTFLDISDSPGDFYMPRAHTRVSAVYLSVCSPLHTGHAFLCLCVQRGGSDCLPWLYMSGIQHGWWKSLILSLSWWNTNELVKTGSSGKQMNFSWCLKSCQIPSLKCFRGTSFW